MAGDAKPVVLRIRLPFTSEPEFLARYGHHLTPQGIFIATRSLKPTGSTVNFELVLQDGSRLLRGEAKVESVVDDPTPGKTGMQLGFVRVDGPSLELLRRVAPPPAPSPMPPPAASPMPPPAASPVPPPAASPVPPPRPSLLPRASAPAPAPQKPHGWGVDLTGAAARLGAWETEGARGEAASVVVPAIAVPSPEGRHGARVGELAERLLTDSSVVPIDVLRALGEAAPALGPSPVELGASWLTEVRERAQAALGPLSSKVVLAVPAGWSSRQRGALAEACASVGLTPRLVHGTTAAAVQLTHGRALARKRLLVVDAGFSACEAAVMMVTGDDVEVLAVGTNQDAGLVGLVERLVPKESTPLDELARRRRVLWERVPLAGPASPVELARGGTGWPWPALAEVLGQGAQAAVATALEAIGSAGLTPSMLDEALLVGPLAGCAWFREPLERALARPLAVFAEPAVLATGAALLGWYDVAKSLGRGAGRVSEPLVSAVGLARRDGTMHRIFEPLTRLPAEKALPFPTSEGAPFAVTLWQGNGALAEGGVWLGGVASTAERTGELVLRVCLTPDARLEARLETPTGRALDVRLTTQLPPVDERAVLVGRSPWVATQAEQQGLFGKMRRFFGS